MADSQTRRGFCTQACWAVSMAAFGGALATLLESCGGGGGNGGLTGASGNVQALPSLSGTASNGALALNVGGSSPLASAGGAAIVQYQSGYLLVARTGQDAFTAVSAICTHQACIINAIAGSDYVCTCHGSAFDLSGRVLSGPAPSSLRQFATSFDASSNTLTISV